MDASALECILRRAAKCEWNQTSRNKCVQSTKVKGVTDLKNALTSHKEMQCLEFAWLIFCLALVQ